MGSSDPGNVTEIVLDAIMQSKIGSTVDVVLSANAPSLDNIRRRLETIPSGLLHVETQDMAKLMSRADIAIGAGGTTSWERCCVGLPSLVITTASNQELIARNLELAGAVLKLGESTDLQPSSIANSIKNLNNNPAHLRSMSMKARAACDGLGLSRLGNYL